MATRSYRQFCPLARGLDLVGERWTLLIVRELLLGPRRYSDLHEALDGIGTNLLAARLRALEERGLVARRRLPAPAASTVYELTDRGLDLEPAILALARFGAPELAAPRADDRFSARWLVLSLQASFHPERAAGLRETYEFRVGEETLHVSVDDGRVSAAQGPAPAPDVTIAVERAEDLAALGSGRVSPQEALASGRVRAEGDLAALSRCVDVLALAS